MDAFDAAPPAGPTAPPSRHQRFASGIEDPQDPVARLEQVFWPSRDGDFVRGSPLGAHRISAIYIDEYTRVGASEANSGGFDFNPTMAQFIFEIRRDPHDAHGAFELRRKAPANSVMVRSGQNTLRTQQGWGLMPIAQWRPLTDGDQIHVNYSNHRGVSYSHGHTFEFQTAGRTCAGCWHTWTHTGTAPP